MQTFFGDTGFSKENPRSGFYEQLGVWGGGGAVSPPAGREFGRPNQYTGIKNPLDTALIELIA